MTYSINTLLYDYLKLKYACVAITIEHARRTFPLNILHNTLLNHVALCDVPFNTNSLANRIIHMYTYRPNAMLCTES